MVNNNYFLTSKITALTTGVVQELANPNKHTIEEYIEILRNPWADACLNIKTQRAAASLGEYRHSNPLIKEFIDENIANMEGSLCDIVATLAEACAYGFMCAEIGKKKVRKNFKTRWALAGFNILDPARVQFAGHFGKPTYLKYRDSSRDIWLQNNKFIHIVHGSSKFNRRSTYGKPECETAFPAVKAYNLILSEMTISAKTLATGILYGQADTDATVEYEGILDSNGRPITKNAVRALADSLMNLENHSHIVTDKKHNITALQIPAGEQFWNLAEQILRRNIFASFGVPSMVIDEGTGALATATLSTKHLSVLDSKINSVVKQIQDQLIEKVFRPLIIFNFGVQKDYGKFEIETANDPQTESMAIQNLITAFSMGLLNQGDIPAVNVLREKLGLTEITPQQQQEQAFLQQQLTLLQGGGGQEEQQPNVPDEEQQQYL